MNSKLRNIPEHIKTVRDAVRWSYNHGFLKGEFPNKTAVDKKLVLDTAEKAIRQAVGEEMLELISTNQKGQFEADGGYIAWYLDDLQKVIKQWSQGAI